ncbi:Putative ABC transporter substrate-binding protein [Streptomyces venezuelae]|uniref:extracellular solute-binding protein n=1 Tax=Streptomyces gardneri TaxID=66892 RepID=UPI0006BE0706|nr:extracellular solute-binding protein [Streptomyces gardneri]ALO12150.1 Putative ABC transporter substrate-binding protein [Streptomyces venezuelae]WRK40466.1 extracellular solute-binding protein [Streptomyces venezuelae]CUM37273.1 putative secreted solute-binding protein [Streptomyces venezuelae]
MNKRMFVAACTIGVLTLTACGGGTGGSDAANGEVTLKLVAADYGDKASNSSTAYWNDVAKRFTAANPKIKVDVQVVNWNDIDAQVKTMIQSGNVPDVLQTGGYADKVADDLLYKAEDVLSESTRANLVDSFAKAGEVDGTQYGIPFVSSARALFYNKTLFAKAGVAEAPKSWDDVRAAAEKIKAKAPGVTPYALPLGPEEAQGESLIWELGNGGGYTDAKGGYTLDSKANIEAFSWLRTNLVEPGLTYANPATTDRKTAFADFAAGKAAMLNGHPSLIQMSKDGKVDYGVAPIPGRDGTLASTLGVADWMMAFKDGGHKEEVKKFLDFAYSKENMLKFDETYNLMPVTEDTLKEMTTNGKHKDLEPFFSLLPKAVFYPLGDTTWDAVSAEIKKSGGTAVNDPAKVLGELQKKAEAAVADQ